MESDKKIEIIQKAIRKLIEDEEAKTWSSNENLAVSNEDEDNEKPGGGGGRHHRQLLSKLLSELESLEEINNVSKVEVDDTITSSSSKEVVGSIEEILKEVKKVKRQNMITHCLLTAMIVLTLAWQLSEVSLILKIKDGFSNPLKSVGGIIGGLFKNRRGLNVQDMMMKQNKQQKQDMIEPPTSFPGLVVPEIPHLGLPGFGDKDEDDDDDD